METSSNTAEFGIEPGSWVVVVVPRVRVSHQDTAILTLGEMQPTCSLVKRGHTKHTGAIPHHFYSVSLQNVRLHPREPQDQLWDKNIFAYFYIILIKSENCLKRVIRKLLHNLTTVQSASLVQAGSKKKNWFLWW